MPILATITPLIPPILLALTVYLLVSVMPERGKSGALKQFRRSNTAKTAAPDAPIGSPNHRVRLAFAEFGLDVAGWEQTAQYAAIAVLAVAFAVPILFFGLPVLLLAAAPFLAWMTVSARIDGAWDKTKLAIEKEIPTLLVRLSSLLKANPNVIATLDSVAEGLDPDKPLKAWIKGFAVRLQSSGRKGLESAIEEAERISPALLLVVVEVGRMWETGGAGYAEAMRLAAANLADLLETRSQASAVAAGAWGTSRTILLALGFTIGSVLVNPVGREAFSEPIIQIGLLAALGWAGLGYWQVRDAIREVTE